MSETITRIVKMKFKAPEVENFKQIFHESYPKIAVFEGCQNVQIFCHAEDTQTMFTISHWESEQALELYRQSELFKSTWAKTKALFEEKAQAWSLINISNNSKDGL